MKLLTIHPINEDLRFLKKFKTELRDSFPDIVTNRFLSNNYSSHLRALEQIQSLESNDMVVFLCHGATRAIYGSEFRKKYGSHPRKYIHSENHGFFIDKNNIKSLDSKKVFCLSCNSTTLGNLAIENGVKVFIGFSTIDFDEREVLLPKQNPRQCVISKTKYSLRKSVYNAIKYSISNDLTFNQLIHLLKVFLNQEIDNLILPHKSNDGFKYYESAANCLLTIKEGIKLFGDGDLKLKD